MTILYPGASYAPLGAQTQNRMVAHDVICLHTMVGSYTSTDRYFRIGNGEGYRGTESHFGVGGAWGPDAGAHLDGAVVQWQDLAFSADANLDGNPTVISIETADNAPARPADIAPWSPAQLDALVALVTWACSTAAHAACPPSWACHQVGIPAQLVADTRPGRRGIGFHAQGVPGVGLVAGGCCWSNSRGKECPGPARIAQLPALVGRVAAGGVPARQSPAGAPPAAAPACAPGRTDLVVDGDLGPATVRRWQQEEGTPIDGLISRPSSLVKAVQRKLSAAGCAPGPVDGLGLAQDGRATETIRALQRYLRTGVDGVLSPGDSATVRAVQTRLNTGRF